MTSHTVRTCEEVRGTWAVMWGILSRSGSISLRRWIGPICGGIWTSNFIDSGGHRRFQSRRVMLSEVIFLKTSSAPMYREVWSEGKQKPTRSLL